MNVIPSGDEYELVEAVNAWEDDVHGGVTAAFRRPPVISPVVQAVLDAALAWVETQGNGSIAANVSRHNLLAAVAVYRATLTPTCPECDGAKWGYVDGVIHPVPCQACNAACGGSGVTPNPAMVRVPCDCPDSSACAKPCGWQPAAAPSTEPAP